MTAPPAWLVTWPGGSQWFTQRGRARGFAMLLRARGFSHVNVDAMPWVVDAIVRKE